MAKTKIGDTPKRFEDQRFLTGTGYYLDDIQMANLAHAVVVRSSHANATINTIDTQSAAASTGVILVLTADNLVEAGIGPLDPYEKVNIYTNEPFQFPTQYPLAKGRVRYIGDPIAFIVAETRDQALDAAECVVGDYDLLPALTSIEDALYNQEAENVCLQCSVGDKRATNIAVEASEHIVTANLYNHRIITNPMEPRGGIGTFNPESGRYTLHISAQSLHMARDRIAETLGVSPKMVRLIAPDVGGGFGVKNFMYQEMILLLWGARITGRPIKWVNTRSESFLSDHQARDNSSEATLALDKNGNFQALRVKSWSNLGAYLSGSMGRIFTEQFVKLPSGPYRIPAVHISIGAVFTNTVPTGVTRGPGFAESSNILERLIDKAALETGQNPMELRRRNFYTAAAMPATNAVGTKIDSGNFSHNITAAQTIADDGFCNRKLESETKGKLRGLGTAYHIKATFGAPEENVEIRFEEDDTITFTTGTQAIGQGHETSFRQILSHLLGLPTENITYRAGDTDLIPKGGGHGSSRATFMAGTAIYMASERIKVKGKIIAAEILEVAEIDIEFAAGNFVIRGTDQKISLMETARRARTNKTPLNTLQEFIREHHTFPNGCHIAEVEIDPETGVVRLDRYTAVDDYGTIINPLLVTGQVHGAISQGVGQALMEQAVYDRPNGQLVSGSFLDYCLPRADDLPPFNVSFAGIPCTTNPLGVKGSGEAGAIAGFPAVTNAILDALRLFTAKGFTGPATPETIWRFIKNNGSNL